MSEKGVKFGKKALMVAAAGIAIAVSASFISKVQPPEAIAADTVLVESPTIIPDLVEEVSPAVVSVFADRVEEGRMGRSLRGMPEEFERFFRFGDPDFDFGAPREGEEQVRTGQGSGFFIDDDGHVVTNNHVIENAKDIRIRLKDGEELEAELIGTDPATDLAVLKVKAPKDQPYVEFTDSFDLRAGETVIALGNPYGFGGTVTRGIVSALGRDIGGPYADFIQIDAAINRGNSGGPTFDLDGDVVGVNTAIISPTGGSVGLGFAIPADVAADVVDQLLQDGSVDRGWLGVSIQPIDDTLAAALGLDEGKGALVADVMEDSPAEKAKVETGDVILRVNGDEIDDARDLTRKIGAIDPGERVRLQVLRDGERKTLNVKLDRRDDQKLASADEDEAPGEDEGVDAEELGFRMAGLNDEMRDAYNVPSDVDGVVVTNVRPGSAASKAGLRRGAIILEAGYKQVKSARDVTSKISNAQKANDKALLLLIQDRGGKRYVALDLT